MPFCANTVFFRIFYKTANFYGVLRVFRESAITYGFYDVNHTSGPRKDPETNPKMDPGASEIRVLPGF